MGVTSEMKIMGAKNPGEAAEKIKQQWKENMEKQIAEHGEDVGIKFDQDKIRMGLLPVRPLEDIAEVLTIGARKYDDHNWRKGFDWSRVYDSLQRHLSDWKKGIDLDEETSKKHLAHAGCCLLFLLEFSHSGAGVDDRVNEHECINLHNEKNTVDKDE